MMIIHYTIGGEDHPEPLEEGYRHFMTEGFRFHDRGTDYCHGTIQSPQPVKMWRRAHLLAIKHDSHFYSFRELAVGGRPIMLIDRAIDPNVYDYDVNTDSPVAEIVKFINHILIPCDPAAHWFAL